MTGKQAAVTSNYPDNAIHVVLCIHDKSGTYTQNAGVVMVSMFENTHSQIIVHIFHDDTLTDDNRQKLIRTAQKYSQGIEFHDLTRFSNIFGQKADEILSKRLTIGTMYRLFIPEVLNVDKAIYLDCDIVVNMDIKELWDIDTEGKYLAVVQDDIVNKQGFFSLWGITCWRMGCKFSTYVNSGVMLMDLNKLRERNLIKDSLPWIEANITFTRCIDQDIYNCLLYGEMKIIDKRFNYHIFDENTDLSNAIIHMIVRKPWQVFPKMYSECLYWEMFLRTAWGEDYKKPEDVIYLLSKINDQSIGAIYIHKTFWQCLKRVIIGAWHRATLWRVRVISAMVIKDIYCKFKYRLKHRERP